MNKYRHALILAQGLLDEVGLLYKDFDHDSAPDKAMEMSAVVSSAEATFKNIYALYMTGENQGE